MIPSCYGRTNQIDTIIISTRGIFVIETKNYRGSIFGDEGSEYWKCYYPSRVKNKKRTFKKLRRDLFNPVKQNNSHISALKVLLKQFNVPYYSIIVFNEDANLKVETLTHVVHISNLLGLINKYKLKVISESIMAVIYKKILDNNIISVQAIKDHREYVRNISIKKKRALTKGKIGLNKTEHHQKVAVAPVQQATAIDECVCIICGKLITEKVKQYCMLNQLRFGGKVYCYDHQRIR